MGRQPGPCPEGAYAPPQESDEKQARGFLRMNDTKDTRMADATGMGAGVVAL